METSRIVILPGLDGTDLLLARFVELAPPGFTATIISLPDDPTDDYETLSRSLAAKLREFAPCHLVAESFSGPIGIRIASRHPEMVQQLTLVASFANSPAPWIASWLPWSMIFKLPLPLAVARYYFVEDNQELAVSLKNTVRQTSTATLAKRVRCLLNINVCLELASISCPVQYLRPTRDRLVPYRAVRNIMSINSSVSVHEIDGPHLILQTRPELAWSVIANGHNNSTRS